MPTSHKEQLKGKIFPKGQVVIPSAIRKKYNIQIGDPVVFSLSDEGILLKPVPATHAKGGLAEKLFGIYATHRASREEMPEENITIATEAGFIEKWRK